MAIPATPRTSRATVGMRRALVAAGLLAVGIGAAAITIVVSRSVSEPPAPETVAVAPAPVTAPAPEKTDAPAPSTIPATAAPAPDAEASTGTLIIRVRPYATVSIDGKHKKDVQGSATFKLPAGVHKVRLDHPRRPYETTVNIRAGKDAVVEQDFRK